MTAGRRRLTALRPACVVNSGGGFLPVVWKEFTPLRPARSASHEMYCLGKGQQSSTDCMEWQAAYREYRKQRVPPELTAVGTSSPRVDASPWLSAAPSSPRNPLIKVCGSWRVLLDERECERQPPQACASATSAAFSTVASPYCVGGRASPKPRAFSARMEVRTLLARIPGEAPHGDMRPSKPPQRSEAAVSRRELTPYTSGAAAQPPYAGAHRLRMIHTSDNAYPSKDQGTDPQQKRSPGLCSLQAQARSRHAGDRAACRGSSPAMRNEYPWIPGGNESFSAVAPPRPVVADPAFPSTGAPASDTLTCGHGAQTRPITASELAACWPGSLRRRSMHAAATTATAASASPRRGGEERRVAIEPLVILSPSTGVLPLHHRACSLSYSAKLA